MIGSLRLLALVIVLAIPVALAAWISLRRRRLCFRRLPLGQAILAEFVGGVLGQMFGLALFALAASYRVSGDVEIVNGIVGYGTLLFSPWAGVGTWAGVTALGERTAHSGRALVVSCAFAVGAVVAFFAGASALKVDGAPWMIVYALSPVVGAFIGYRVGGFGFSTGLFGRPARTPPESPTTRGSSP